MVTPLSWDGFNTHYLSSTPLSAEDAAQQNLARRLPDSPLGGVLLTEAKKSLGYGEEVPPIRDTELWDTELVEISFNTLKSSKWEIVHRGPEGVNC